MGSRLINVRLDAERLRKVQVLRERGVPLSDVVREAIDERFSVLRSESSLDAGDVVRRLFEEHPDPPGLPARGYDVHDRRAARKAVLGRLQRKRR